MKCYNFLCEKHRYRSILNGDDCSEYTDTSVCDARKRYNRILRRSDHFSIMNAVFWDEREKYNGRK